MVAITGDLVDKDNPKINPAISLIQGLPIQKGVNCLLIVENYSIMMV